MQLVDSVWQPLEFFSRQPRPCERKYSTFDRELLGLYLAIRHYVSCWRLGSFRGPQAIDIRNGEGFGAVVCPSAVPARLHLRVYHGHQPCGG